MVSLPSSTAGRGAGGLSTMRQSSTSLNKESRVSIQDKGYRIQDKGNCMKKGTVK